MVSCTASSTSSSRWRMALAARYRAIWFFSIRAIKAFLSPRWALRTNRSTTSSPLPAGVSRSFPSFLWIRRPTPRKGEAVFPKSCRRPLPGPAAHFLYYISMAQSRCSNPRCPQCPAPCRWRSTATSGSDSTGWGRAGTRRTTGGSPSAPPG